MLVFHDRLRGQERLGGANVLFKLLERGPGGADLRTGKLARAERHEDAVVERIAVQLRARRQAGAVVADNGLIDEILRNECIADDDAVRARAF